MATKVNRPARRKVTPTMIAGAKPAAFTGCMFGGGKVRYVCWPGVRFPGERHVIVLEKRQCRSADAAVARAARILSTRKSA